MKARPQYAMVETQWGTAAFAATERGLCRFWMPVGDANRLVDTLAAEGITDGPHTDLLGDLQSQIISYFAGHPVRFECPLDFRGLPAFSRRVLSACFELNYGETVSYGELARRSGHPRAARAVGTVMSRNRIPLIIPCHRVIRGDGGLGGFGAEAGVALKRRLLLHEGVALPP